MCRKLGVFYYFVGRYMAASVRVLHKAGPEGNIFVDVASRDDALQGSGGRPFPQ
jgi:hypothetical protein